MNDQAAAESNQVITLESPEYMAMHERAIGTNVNEQTLLATDYLNHFNEVIMLLEMIPDMPDMLEDAQEWQPKSYKEHFEESSIADKDLAIEAFDVVPNIYKDPFEQTIAQLNSLVVSTTERIEKDLNDGNIDLARENAKTMSRQLQRLVDVAGGIIHGSESGMEQSEIDILLGN
jgi:hypothetical protein